MPKKCTYKNVGLDSRKKLVFSVTWPDFIAKETDPDIMIGIFEVMSEGTLEQKQSCILIH